MAAAEPSSLTPGGDGNLYGTTEYGGTYDEGTVFQVTTAGAVTTLYSFTGEGDGAFPADALDPGSERQPLRPDRQRRHEL